MQKAPPEGRGFHFLRAIMKLDYLERDVHQF